MTTPPHVPVSGVQCSNCHTNTAASFVTYTMTHSAVSASRCDSCHNGSYTGEGTKGAQGTASFPGHVATGGRDCITCHANCGDELHQLGGRHICPPSDRHQLFQLPQRDDAIGLTTPPHSPGHRRPVQQLPHQFRDQLPDLHDEPLGGERQPLRCLPQRLLHRRRHQGCKGHRVLCRPRRDRRARLHHLSRRSGSEFHQLGGRHLRPPGRPTRIVRAATTARRQPV